MARYEKGQSSTFTKKITDEEIRRFAEITGDCNPVHLDDEYAKNSPFKARIAHGFLTGAMISKILGMDFPGPGTVYLSQTMKFMAPAYLGDILTAEVVVEDFDEEKNRMKLITTIRNQNDKLILSGEAVVLPPK